MEKYLKVNYQMWASPHFWINEGGKLLEFDKLEEVQTYAKRLKRKIKIEARYQKNAEKPKRKKTSWDLKTGDTFKVRDTHWRKELIDKVGTSTEDAVQGNGFGYVVTLAMQSDKKKKPIRRVEYSDLRRVKA
jgi:hypothetical protein